MNALIPQIKDAAGVYFLVCKPDNTRLRVFMNGFKISDIHVAQLILPLIFRFWVICVQKIGSYV